jgi:hypothetical protein
MNHTLATLCTLGCFVAVGVPTEAFAQSDADKRALAETLFYAARGMMEDGRIADACRKFEESYRLDPASGTLINMAVCHEKEGRSASAWGEYRQALSEAKHANNTLRESLASEGLARTEPKLNFLTLEVSKPARLKGLVVKRNQVALADAAFGVRLPVDKGATEIEISAPGYVTKKITININIKVDETVSVPVLLPSPVIVTTFEREESGPTSRQWIGVGVGVVGLASIGAGGFFGLRARKFAQQSNDVCPVFDGERRCSQDGVDRMSSANSDAWLSNIAIGVGVAAVATSVVLIVTGRRPRADSTQLSGAVTNEGFQFSLKRGF